MSAFASDIDARVPFSWEDREPILELDFEIAEYRARIDRLQRLLADEQIDAMVVYGGDAECSVRYLSGFFNYWGDTVVLIPQAGEPTLITNAIYHGEPMHSNIQTTWMRDVRVLLNAQSTKRPHTVVAGAADLIGEWGLARGRVAYADTRHLPMRIHAELRERLPDAVLVDGSKLLRGMRAIKSAAEQEAIRELGVITSAAMDAGLAIIEPGVTESEVAGAIIGAAVAAGAERCQTFISSGQRSFMKNVYALRGKVVEPGEFLNVDMAAKYRGYQSDMARVGIPGRARPQDVALFEACLAAEEAGLAVVRDGVEPIVVLQTMSAVIADHGFAAWDFTTSHGGGLELAEDPYFVAGADPLRAGMTFYIEPMIVPTEIGSVCIEDMLIVTEDGAEQVTSSPKVTW
ncbi:Xaa-Pro peptidase family protein [Conexibacter sp. CPCC 206217]|uniref:M24 family metallopeptidase n=1 Tax=Conexibacter sp. CPCC 206217 TaxID=3064574 RepID=UPI002715CECC|nr:Xaa-Pro peptidase family protein [Conexibacter sp. CPCC 206217]MDO8213550.1 Xaa-Pro peptidase family protein [Conexibacter sp. CPCC 206217]